MVRAKKILENDSLINVNMVYSSIKNWLITIFGALVNVLCIIENTIDENSEKKPRNKFVSNLEFCEKSAKIAIVV